MMMAAPVNVALVTAVLLLLNPEATIKSLAHLPAFLSTGKPAGATGNKSTTGLRRSSSPKYLTPDLELVIKGPFFCEPCLIQARFPSIVRTFPSLIHWEIAMMHLRNFRFLKLLKLYGSYTLCYSEMTTFPGCEFSNSRPLGRHVESARGRVVNIMPVVR
jgi:hypothetical protein